MLNLVKKYKKKISIFLATFLLVSAMPFQSIVFANEVEKLEMEPIALSNTDILLESKQDTKSTLAMGATLAPMAFPGLVKILQVFGVAIVGAGVYESGVVQNFLKFIGNLTSNLPSVADNVKSKLVGMLEKCHGATLALLVAYENFNTSTGKIKDNFRSTLSEYFKETFLLQLEELVARGVSLGTLATYGVTQFFKMELFNEMSESIPGMNSFPALKYRFGNPPINSGNMGAYRNLTFNVNDSGAIGYHNTGYNISAGKDIVMDFVDKVQITRGNVSDYNYGWEGVSWKQQYFFTPAKDGKLYMLVIAVAKALSPNQKLDYFHDGISFGFYEVDSLGNIVAGNENNRYFRTADGRLDTYIPTIGTNLYSGGKINFGDLRNICADLYGKDLFPDVPTSWDYSTDISLQGNRIADYSKNEPGVYNKNWDYVADVHFPVPGLDDNITFPTLKPGQSVTIPGVKPGDAIYNPGVDTLFPPITYPNGNTITRPGDITSNPSLDTDFGDIYNPGIDVPDVDNPGIDVPNANTGLIQKIIELIQKILDWLSSFWDKLVEVLTGLLTSLFVPSDDYWVNNFNTIEGALKDKIPGLDLEPIKELANKENVFEDIYATIFGKRCLIVRASLINEVIGWARPILQGVIALFLLLYNYNQIYHLLRSHNIVDSGRSDE